jgi:hypothetical protein
MRPAISPSGTLFVMISQEDMNNFRTDQDVTALGVLVHLMARVSLDPYRTQVRSRTLCNQWFIPTTFFELQESTGMTTAALMLGIQALEADGWIERTENGYLLRDAAKEKSS